MRKISFDLKALAQKIQLVRIPAHVSQHANFIVGNRFNPATKFVRIQSPSESKIIPLLPMTNKMYLKLGEQRTAIIMRLISFLIGCLLYMPFICECCKFYGQYDFRGLLTIVFNNIWTLILGFACVHFSIYIHNKIKNEKIQSSEWDKHCNHITLSSHHVFSMNMADRPHYIYVYPYSEWSMLVGYSSQFLHHITNTNNKALTVPKNANIVLENTSVVLKDISDLYIFSVYDIHLTNDEYVDINNSFKQAEYTKNTRRNAANAKNDAVVISVAFFALCAVILLQKNGILS